MIALGVGEPVNVIRCMKIGYQMFDSSLPTRDARQGRLYAFEHDYSPKGAWREEGFDNIYIRDEKHVKNGEPISPHCDCLACAKYTTAFLHHLFNVRDPLYCRLATIHNLRFMTLLMRDLKGSSDEERRFEE
jgi:queuine tRNA-ribosyltransferase